MDLGLFAQVIRRHRTLVVTGVVVTALVATLSFVRIGTGGISYRQSEEWTDRSTVLLTQPGFPEGRSVLSERRTAPGYADPQRLSDLADVYAALATGDRVVSELQRRGLVGAAAVESGDLPVRAAAVTSSARFSGSLTPMIRIAGRAASPEAARALTLATTDAFLDVVAAEQDAAGIPPAERLKLDVVRATAGPALTTPRRLTMPILLVIAGLVATVAAAFVRENGRRARRARLAGVPAPEGAEAGVSAPVIRPVPDEAVAATAGAGAANGARRASTSRSTGTRRRSSSRARK